MRQSLMMPVISRSLGLALLVSLSVSSLCSPAWAAHQISNATQPLQAQLTTAIDGETAQPGDPFEAVLKQDHQYHNHTLPAGTTIHGTVKKAENSKPFSRNGYVVLDVDTITLPNGLVFTVDEDKYKYQPNKIKDNNAESIGSKLLYMAGSSVVSLGTSLPLGFATGLSRAAIVPIGFGAKMLYGATVENTKDDDRSMPEKTAYGLFRGTGLPGAYNFVAPAPNVALEQGEAIQVYMPPTALKDLFNVASSPANQAMADKPTLMMSQDDKQADAVENVQPETQQAPSTENKADIVEPATQATTPQAMTTTQPPSQAMANTQTQGVDTPASVDTTPAAEPQPANPEPVDPLDAAQ